MVGRGARARIDMTAPTRTTADDRSRTVMRKSGGDHVSNQVSQTSCPAVAEASIGNFLIRVVVAVWAADVV